MTPSQQVPVSSFCSFLLLALAELLQAVLLVGSAVTLLLRLTRQSSTSHRTVHGIEQHKTGLHLASLRP